MNLLFGSTSAETFDSLLACAQTRYKEAPSLAVPQTLGLIRSEDDGPVGSVTEQDVTIMLLGILNYGTDGLSGDANKDAKTALTAYLSNGISGLVNLQGQFLISIYDKRDQSMIIVPDSNGLRTAYYTDQAATFAFSTNLKTLATGLPQPAGHDGTYQNFLLSHGFIPFCRTMYKGIYKLPADKILIYKSNKIELENRSNYTGEDKNHPLPDFSSMDESALIDELHKAFSNAIREQLSPDKKVAVLLGGFDSALVAAYLAAEGKEVHTYSFGYSDESYNQAHIDTVVAHTGCIHHWIPMTAETIREGIRDFDRYFNAPTNWANYVIQTEAVCQKIREDGIRHVYSGDGCDTIFLGYPFVHKTSVIFKRLGRWPDSLINTLTKVLDFGWLENLLGRPYAVGLHLIRSVGRDMPQRGLLTFQIMDANSARRIQGDDYNAATEDNEVLLKKLAAPFTDKTPDRIAYSGKSLLSPNLSKMIGTSDSTGTVIQAPYLHPELKKMALNLPDELCRPNGQEETKITGKYILMRMAEIKGMLPRDTIYQKKVSAVDAPLDEWLKHDLKDECSEFLKDLPFKINPSSKNGLFKKKFIEELHRKHIASDNLTVHALSLLLSYSRFTKKDKT
ncbi:MULTISPECIES: asparagine synthetase B family protein [unclassified Lentimonas]|uniref:asparagine synthase-related protein n=1 Tax=unclassified Lentimonas TaxID=2630993 RepID=UPI00132AA8A0|nr:MULTISPECIES: asparagine synthetase B family protein [unclassified Lentimonas]CAA6691137.1 Unannotated [Lentimonas sp. CC10]CAA6693759.1 Unannotated [Lentimonas sp. CC19]CAA7070129.1 Unannotated [Lentimonas sp. CC11]